MNDERNNIHKMYKCILKYSIGIRTFDFALFHFILLLQYEKTIINATVEVPFSRSPNTDVLPYNVMKQSAVCHLDRWIASFITQHSLVVYRFLEHNTNFLFFLGLSIKTNCLHFGPYLFCSINSHGDRHVPISHRHLYRIPINSYPLNT